VKWSFLDRKSAKPVWLVVNADESEPGTFKDREIIHRDPHQIIEGALIAARATGAARVFIYIRGEFPHGAKILEAAAAEARAAGLCGEGCGAAGGVPVEIVVHRGGGCYVCGEETGLLESLEGKRGCPRLKPPFFPAVNGLYGCPTIVNNAETLAQVRRVLEVGGAAFAKTGVTGDTGTRIWGVSGHVQRPGLREIEAGAATVGDLLYDMCGGPRAGRRFKALIPGGSSTKVLRFGERFTGKTPAGDAFDWGVEDIPLDAVSLGLCGTSAGTGGMIVMDDSTNLAAALANLCAFYAHESCGQCVPCREGTQWLARLTARIADGDIRDGDAALLRSAAEKITAGGANAAVANAADAVAGGAVEPAPPPLADQISGRTICALGDAAAWPVQSFMAKFGDEILAPRARPAGTGGGTGGVSQAALLAL